MPDSATKACANCGVENDPAARFCGNCGARLPEGCPHCGAPVHAGQRFCSQCGRPCGPASNGGRRVRTPQYLAERIVSAGRSSVSENKIATVLFADVAGSTALIRDLNAEDADRILAPTVEIMARVVHRYEGAVREEGDGIMASFGAPIAHEDHAVRACNAALEIQEAIRRHAADVRRDFGRLLQVRIGVNSGPVVVRVEGQEGDFIDLRMQGTPINVASRLEKLAAPGSILLARETFALAEGFIRTGPFETVTVKGIDQRLEVCELHGVNTRMRIHARAARGLSKFVGREDELKQLARAAAQARSGHGQVVALVGEPGVGKSRVFLEFARSPRMQGWLVLEASSVSYGRATSYLPLVDLLSRYFEVQARDDEHQIRERIVRKLSALGEPWLLAQAPVFLGTLGMGANEEAWTDLTPSDRQTLIFDAVRRLLIRESQIQPLALTFEDLHWIDPETQTFLDALVESISAARVLMLVNYRPEYRLRWAAKGHFSQIRIDPLPPPTADELLEVLLGPHAELGPMKQELIRVTEGNPLFLEESVRNLIEKGVLSSRAGQWHQVRDLPEHDRVPPRIDALVAERIDRLQPHLKQTLQCAAVLGNDIPRALLEAVNDLKGHALDRAIWELQVADFLYEKALFPETEYSFKHSMTREVAYQHLLTDRRMELHAGAARALESLAAERLEEHVERLADHAEKGGLWDKALEYLRRSGAKAYSLYANEQAAKFFRQALEVLGRLPDGRAKLELAVDLRFDLRNALLGLGATDEILRCLTEVRPLLEALGDKARKARYAAFRCNYHFLAAEQREAIRFGSEGLNDARDCGDRLVQGELLYRVGQSHLALGETRTAIARLEESLKITDERTRGRYDLVVLPAVVGRTWLVQALVECGEFADGMRRAAEAVRIAESEHPPSLALGWLATGHLLLRKGEFLGAVNALKLALGLCDKYKWSLRVWRPRVLSTLGVAHARSGDTADGLELARQAVNDAEQMRLNYDRPLLLVRLGQASLIAGHADKALQLGEQAVRIAQSHEAKCDEAWARFLIARSCWAANPPKLEESASQLESALRLAGACEARPLIAFCNTALSAVRGRLGDQVSAQQLAAAAAASYKELDLRPLPLDPAR